MSVRVMGRVWAQSKTKDGKLLVMLALADFANDEGESWPSMPVLADKARLSERQARKVLDKLEQAGEIRRVRSNGGRNRRNHYVILLSENPDIRTLKKEQGLNNPVLHDQKTLSPVTGALNRHRTVNKERVKDKPSLPKNSDPRVKEFLSWWDEEYQKRVSESYVFSGGKEGSLIKNLLHTFDLPKLRSLALLFLDSQDPWVLEHGGYTIGVFASQINKLVSTAKANDNSPPRKEMPA